MNSETKKAVMEYRGGGDWEPVQSLLAWELEDTPEALDLLSWLAVGSFREHQDEKALEYGAKAMELAEGKYRSRDKIAPSLTLGELWESQMLANARLRNHEASFELAIKILTQGDMDENVIRVATNSQYASEGLEQALAISDVFV